MSFEYYVGLCEVAMRTLTPTLRHQDVWTPSDVASFAGIDIKTALKLVRRLPHLRAGRRYFVARAVVLAQLGLDPTGTPLAGLSIVEDIKVPRQTERQTTERRSSLESTTRK